MMPVVVGFFGPASAASKWSFGTPASCCQRAAVRLETLLSVRVCRYGEGSLWPEAST
jgi:hypothetical protein